MQHRDCVGRARLERCPGESIPSGHALIQVENRGIPRIFCGVQGAGSRKELRRPRRRARPNLRQRGCCCSSFHHLKRLPGMCIPREAPLPCYNNDKQTDLVFRICEKIRRSYTHLLLNIHVLLPSHTEQTKNTRFEYFVGIPPPTTRRRSRRRKK